MHMGPENYGFGPHWDFSWIWPLMIFFFALGGWRRFVGHHPEHHRRYELPPQPVSAPANDPASTTLRERFAEGDRPHGIRRTVGRSARSPDAGHARGAAAGG